MFEFVSIIIPAYNAEKYLTKALESVLWQHYSKWEAIVINDGSIDETGVLADSFAKKDSRIKVVHQANKGCSAAKNVGLKLAKGQYIQYLDADDILSSDKIMEQLIILDKNPNSIAVCKTHIFERDINHISGEIDTNLINKNVNGLKFLYELWGGLGKIGMVQPNAYLIPRSIADKIGFWDETLSPSLDEDGEYFARAIAASDKVIFTNGVNYYRKSTEPDSLSNQKKFSHIIGLFKTIQKKFEPLLEVKEYNFAELYSIQLTHFLYQYGNQYPELFEVVNSELKNKKLFRFKFIGKNNFAKLVTLIGFRNAMRIKSIYNSSSYNI